MDEIFKNIDVKKRDRIINSALEEFSKNKYDKASTNNIVKNANISKGLLYHYFASKKELFEYLESFVMMTIINEIQEELDWNVSDFFIRIKEIVKIKFEVTHRYPYIFNFAVIVFANRTVEELQKIYEGFSPNLYNKIYTYNIDYTMFKDGIDIKKALTIIRWTFEKYSEELFEKHIKNNEDFDYKALEQEINQYIEVLRDAFYK